MQKMKLDVDGLVVETFPLTHGDVLPSLDGATLTACCSGYPTCGTCPPPMI
jgi:hypothetical protein